MCSLLEVHCFCYGSFVSILLRTPRLQRLLSLVLLVFLLLLLVSILLGWFFFHARSGVSSCHHLHSRSRSSCSSIAIATHHTRVAHCTVSFRNRSSRSKLLSDEVVHQSGDESPYTIVDQLVIAKLSSSYGLILLLTEFKSKAGRRQNEECKEEGNHGKASNDQSTNSPVSQSVRNCPM